MPVSPSTVLGRTIEDHHFGRLEAPGFLGEHKNASCNGLIWGMREWSPGLIGPGRFFLGFATETIGTSALKPLFLF